MLDTPSNMIDFQATGFEVMRVKNVQKVDTSSSPFFTSHLYSRYARLFKLGMPVEHLRLKMISEGVDVGFLDEVLSPSERTEHTLIFYPYSKVQYLEFFSRGNKYAVNVAFGNSPLEVLEVTCKDREEAKNFYQKFKQELKFWQH